MRSLQRKASIVAKYRIRLCSLDWVHQLGARLRLHVIFHHFGDPGRQVVEDVRAVLSDFNSGNALGEDLLHLVDDKRAQYDMWVVENEAVHHAKRMILRLAVSDSRCLIQDHVPIESQPRSSHPDDHVTRSESVAKCRSSVEGVVEAD